MKYMISKAGDGWTIAAMPDAPGETATTLDTGLMLLELGHGLLETLRPKVVVARPADIARVAR